MTTVLEPVEPVVTRQIVPPDLWPSSATRSMDGAHFNAVANDPTVRPFLGGEGPIDLSGGLANPAHVGIATAHGGFVLFNQGQGCYEAHSMFLPDGRGREAFDAMRATTAYMFGSTDCVEILTKVATTNRAAAALALRGGFEFRFDGHVRWSEGELVPHQFYSLTLERWCLRSPDTLRLGEWFHTALETLKAQRGSTVPAHPDDAAHNHYAGAAVLMIHGGNLWKAVRYYNRWARFAGYEPMRVVEEHPIVLDLGGMFVAATADAMEILSCP